MAEAAGTAIGAVSLGIQVCNGLIGYIDSARGAEERLTQISNQMDHLASILELLESVVSKLGDRQSVTQAREESVACSQALQKIREKLDSLHCRSRGPGCSIKERLKKFKKLAVFPFKEDGLLVCKNIVESVQGNLNTVLLVLNIDQSRIKTENVERLILERSQSIERSMQSINDEQRRQYETTALPILGVVTMTQSHVLSSESRIADVQATVGLVHNSLRLAADSMNNMARDTSNIEARLSRLEANLEKRTLHSLSPVAIQEDYYEVDHLSRRINKTRHRSAKRNRGAPPCFCYKTSSTTFYLQGPMHLSRTVTTRHRPHCPYSAMEQATAQLSVRLSTCILALRSKFEFALSFSHSAGRVSVSPGLICSRVVEDSPAFSLVRSIHLRIVQPRKRMAKQTGDQIVKELKKVFATRAAFIHDKLPDGRTLLDELLDGSFAWWVLSVEYVDPVFKFLLESQPLEILETRDSLVFSTAESTADNRDYYRFVRGLLDFGMPLDGERLSKAPPVDWKSRLRNYRLDYSDLECTEAMKCFILHDESYLVTMLNNKVFIDYRDAAQEKVEPLYQWATIYGWRRGCETLYEYGVPIQAGYRSTLLRLASYGRHPDVLEFWLKIRPSIDDTETLGCIGSLEDPLTRTYDFACLEVLISALAEDRAALQHLAISRFPPEKYTFDSEQLLDSEAYGVYEDLKSSGLEMNPSLEPCKRTIYADAARWALYTFETLEILWNVGFRNPTGPISRAEPISPLLFYLTSKLCWNFEPAEWFLSRGAQLSECWPGTELTALHLTGWTCGVAIGCYGKGSFKWGHALRLVKETCCADGCRCSCSTSGCTFLTMVFKGIPLPQRRGRTSSMIRELAEFITPMMERAHPRWLISVFFRPAIFFLLDCRHTCCDPSRLLHDGEDLRIYVSLSRENDLLEAESNSEITSDLESAGDTENKAGGGNGGAGDDYIADSDDDNTKEHFQDIESKDSDKYSFAHDPHEAYLQDLLESLLEEFEQAYDASGLELDRFVDKIFLPRMDAELQRLKVEDEELYGEGRRQMGVIIEELN